MTFTVSQSAGAVCARCPASFGGVGGAEPYLYSVLPGGAGGTINATTGQYTAPATAPTDPKLAYDTIEVEDYANIKATARILVGRPLDLFCEILQRGMGLANGRVYWWSQKINQPTDSDLYIAVSVPSVRPFGNVNRQVQTDTGMVSEQFTSVCAVVDIDIISRSTQALFRKEEVLLALNSVYSQNQQAANSFRIGKIPPRSQFVNIAHVDGMAIPYRYRISLLMQYAVGITTPVDYFDEFDLEAHEEP